MIKRIKMEADETESGSNVLQVDICQRETISHTLSSAPHIVQSILICLDARNLVSCARVCRLWRDTVKVLKPKRKTLSWTCIDCEEEGEETHQGIKDFIQTLYTEPSILFMFCQTDLYDSPIRISSPTPSAQGGRTRYSRSSKRPKAEIGDYVKSLLPAGCELVGVTTDGVVGTSTDLSTMYEFESHKAISFLSLPKLDGVDIEVFTVDVYEAVCEHLDIGSLSPVSNEKDVKLIVFLSDNPDWSHRLGYMMLKHYPRTAIAGGYVDNLVVPKPCHFKLDSASEPQPSMTCVAFSGPRVKVTTMVVKETIQTEDSFEKEVKKLKNLNLSEKNSFCFMFACVGRGSGLYGQENVETTIFKKYFPKTPLVGFFGNGEVGFNWFPNSGQDSDSAKEARNEIKMFHGYTTILCFVSLL